MVRTDKKHSLRILAGLLKARMYAAGVTQRDVADAAGVTPGLVSMVINGRRKNAKVMKLIEEMTRDAQT